ncbi:MAG: hypothetical protein BAJALOKI2v1_270005 [Promethearchaeota archaeon]|nr:MAG: hypothetical protein BAJALOKI2v1_270005 [Candidatus Lokiarchaeota archaeon]
MKIKLSPGEVNSILDAIQKLIDLKLIFRKTAPQYNLDEETTKKFLNTLNHLRTLLNPIFSIYLKDQDLLGSSLIKKIKKTIASFADMRDQILVSSNSAKKVLKSLGVDPRDIIVSGGPLFYEDYKTVNPNIPDKALESIKKKCERVLEDIKSKDWEKKDLIFIYEKDDIGDMLILDKIPRLEHMINKDVKTIALSSWDDLT